MKKKFSEMPTPLNANERFLFGIGERLEALLDAIESIGNVKETPVVDEPAPVKVPASRKRSVKVTAKPKEE